MTFMNPRSAEASPTRPWPAERIEHWPIERLIPYTNNPRLHSEADVDKIAASIRRWGWTNPALVDENGTLIAGHGRVAAAVKLKLTAKKSHIFQWLTTEAAEQAAGRLKTLFRRIRARNRALRLPVSSINTLESSLIFAAPGIPFQRRVRS